MKKRVLSLLLALVMVLGMLPTAALAVDDTELAPVLRIGEGSKEREVTATALTSYTIGEMCIRDRYNMCTTT